ncbi:Choline/ethanolamine kinase [Babesia microti strain RI]|uniref:Choline/ethanolamine kinase n=1 Tax=Babesia microti (strain RI) TaxID=1133968 RepID=A0A1N6LWH6_BABMR|nr:Choline/ethanolamine kinase [Babesia microti strain RI]SIO73224.1 Choline/ethanolamine kinase [Babesia microti strain RI]|eukprot:XP_021337332.1 Choline/ethanolamine kinase [Babesia microti strain RI]
MDNELGYNILSDEFTPIRLLSDVEDGFDLENKNEGTSDECKLFEAQDLKTVDSNASPTKDIIPSGKHSYDDIRLELDDKGNYSIDSIANVCINNIKGWNHLSKTNLNVNAITLGTSSTLFSVEVHKNVESVNVRKVFFRIYSQKAYELYDNSFESEVFEMLAKCKLGPKLIAYTYGGRIEEWIDGNVLTYDQLQDISILKSVAELISVMHRKLHTKVAPFHWDRNPSLIRYLNRWSNGSLRGPLINQKRVNLHRWVEEKNIYCEALKNYVKTHKSLAFNLGFCHNDVHENNIMMDLKGRLRLVDFEYSGFNYVGCDIGNVIVESMIDYSSESPSKYKICYEKHMDDNIKREFVAFYISNMQESKVDAYSEVVDDFIHCVDILTLGLHLYWGFWSVLRASAAPMEKKQPLDFIKYANERFSMYIKAKDTLESDFIQYLEKAKRGNS